MKPPMIVLAAVIAAAPALAAAEPYQKEGCQLEAPAGWVASKTRIARADKKMWASLLQAPSNAEAVRL